MEKNTTKIPPFVAHEVATAFALCLRSQLNRRAPGTKAFLAEITEATESTVANWTKADPRFVPSVYKFLSILYALDAWQDFWSRLKGADEALTDQVLAAHAALKSAKRKIGNHPPPDELEAALDLLVHVQRELADVTDVIRTEQKIYARREAPE